METTRPSETTYTPADLIAAARKHFGEAWAEGHASFHEEDWLYWRTAHALAEQEALVKRETVDRVCEVLHGQGIALDSELDNWTFHAPFWAIRRAMFDDEGVTDDEF